jgi:phenylpropionate dioxygenase-like ring-hydroxylating dioxygenase large terminal subunit
LRAAGTEISGGGELVLSKEENQLLTRVGRGTEMGELLRQYWIPALQSQELPGPDCDPLRLRLLGEDLIAFRDTNGRVGFLGNNCPHRGASLFFGRNEESGLRCVYHGWKFDTSGACLDMPNEPAESDFKHKVRAVAYPAEERGGVVWAYLGTRSSPPPLPDLEWMVVPAANRVMSKTLRECNWVQALEGDIDTAHLYFLHSRLDVDSTTAFRAADSGVYHEDRHPRLHLVRTDYGMMYGAQRDEPDGRYYWRITQFMMPFHTLFPPGGLAGVPGHIWVPIDDHHTMVWFLIWNPLDAIPEGEHRLFGANPSAYLPTTSGPLGQWRMAANVGNDYMIDREVQRTKTFTGIPTIPLQDQAITESMGPICDRSQEHLGSTDAMVIQVRRRLLDAARALQDEQITPPGVDNPEQYRVRTASVVLDRDADWQVATREVLKAFSALPVANA